MLKKTKLDNSENFNKQQHLSPKPLMEDSELTLSKSGGR
jgi:hypothetical protein